MQPQGVTKEPSENFLLKKSVFLLASSVGKATAEKLIEQAIIQLRIDASRLAVGDIPRLAGAIEPSLRALVGNDKAQKLGSALRVLVGGAISG
jgi:hypothetical protein